jgi:hypothetical protein
VRIGPLEYLPLATGMRWSYRVTVPATVALPYQPIPQLATVACSNLFCGMVTWQAGTYNFNLSVGDAVADGYFNATFRAAATDPGPRFYFGTATASTPLLIGVNAGEEFPGRQLFANLYIMGDFVGVGTLGRVYRALAQIQQSQLTNVEPVTVPAGTYPDAIRVGIRLAGNGKDVTGTYDTDVWVAPRVGVVKAIMKDATGRTLYTQELTAISGN